jgi:hypothetical protein
MRGDLVALKRIVVHTTSPRFRRGLISTRDRMLDLHARWRNTIGWSGRLPNFIVAGTQKGGTTELYDQLVLHPQIAPSFAKEVHFFDANFNKGTDWYTAFFPRVPDADVNRTAGCITGEASPCYLFHPDVARRVWATIPHVKIILLLRNPVDRAYSHYHHEVRLGYETLPFERALAREEVRLQGEKAKMLRDKHYYSNNYMHYSYLSRGIYIDQVKSWSEVFPQEQMLVLKSEDFFANTASVMSQVHKFLGVPDVEMVKMDRHKSFPYPKMDQTLRQRLLKYFEPYNQELYDYLGRDFCWS